MTWTKVDDGLHSHPKVLRLWQAGHQAALGLHLLAMSYIGAYLTDGVIHRPFVLDKDGLELAAHLVEAGLWDVEGEDWRVHDWLDYNPSRADVDRKRKASAQRAKRSRQERQKRARKPGAK